MLIVAFNIKRMLFELLKVGDIIKIQVRMKKDIPPSYLEGYPNKVTEFYSECIETFSNGLFSPYWITEFKVKKVEDNQICIDLRDNPTWRNFFCGDNHEHGKDECYKFLAKEENEVFLHVTNYCDSTQPQKIKVISLTLVNP
jgi:hypothetical protein